ncbi:MAG TPA: SpoIIE family protein phosphatase [Azospirillaceae bacterium]|nr:SpoIIE family protein phosphatase [Azospirillaceae bacterium]
MDTEEQFDLGPILLVDDDPLSLDLMAVALDSLGYRVATAASGTQALELLRREPIGLVVTDWVMPDGGGADLCRAIRETILDRYVYVLVLTARTDRHAVIDVLEAGADDFLSKPPNLEELKARIASGRRIQGLERQLDARNRHLAAANAKLEQAYGRIQADLSVAARSLRRQLPAPARMPGLAFDWLFDPSSMIGGDIFNVVTHPDTDLVVFYQIDVAGHGIPAALTSFTLHALLSGAAARHIGDPRHSGDGWLSRPADVVGELNRRACRAGDDDRYFTMLYGVLDRRTGQGCLTLAGNPRPLIWRAAEARWEQIGEGGFPVGLFEQADYEAMSFELDEGDRLVLYSDGVSECSGLTGEAFTEERLGRLLAIYGDRRIGDFVRAVDGALRDWRPGDNYDDDVSLLVLERTAWQERER